MATAHPKPLGESGSAVPEPQHTDFEAVQEEIKQLRMLVIQLSKLVVKYVMHQN